MSAGPGGFDVVPTSLRDAASRADGDAAEIESAGRAGTAALGAGAGGCGGPQLTAALHALSDDLAGRTAQVAGAVRAAGGVLGQTADSYEGADRVAAASVGGAVPPGIGDAMFGGMAR